MADTRDKVRSVFLTALMVISVFGATVAFTGTAAAQPADVDQDPVEFTFPDGETNHIEIVFDETSGTVPTADDAYELEDRNGDTVDVTVNDGLSDAANGRVVLNIGENLNGEPTLTVTADGESEEYDVTTTATSIPRPADTGSAEVFKGERVAVSTIQSGETNVGFGLKRGGSDQVRFLSRSTGEDSFIGTIDTGNINQLTAGDTRYLTFDGGGNVSIGVRDLGLSIEAEEDSYTFTEDEGSADIEATANSNVVNRQVEFRLKEGGDYEDNNKSRNIGSDGEADISFNVDEEGNYSVEVVDLPTDISDETGGIEVAEVTGDASFARGVFTEQRGDVARLTLNMQNRDEATINIGDDDVGYTASVDVADDDDDGQVVLLFNTFAPGQEGSFEVNDEDDSIEDVNIVTPVNNPLAAAAYTINATEGDRTGAEMTRASLNLRERSTTDMRSWTAPQGSMGDFDDGAAVAEYVAAGNLTQDSTIADNDVVVLQLRASGLEGAINDTIASTEASNPTEALAALEDPGQTGGQVLNFSLYQSQNSKAPNADQVAFELSDLDDGDRSVVMDPQNDTVYVALNSGGVIGQSDALEVDDVVEANMTLNDNDLAGANALVARNERQTSTAQFRVVDDELEFDTNEDDLVLVRAASDQRITGTSTVAPGTEITVTASSTGASAFLVDNETEIQPNGTFTAVLSFENVTTGQNFTLEVTDRSFDNDAEADGRVREAATGSVTFEDQSTDGQEVTVASAELSEGGFITIHDESLQEGDALGSVRGTSDYLENGSQSDVTVTLDDPVTETQTLIAMPHMDTNDNQQYDFVSSDGAEDGPYTANGSALTDSAEVTVETETPTPTQTAEPTPTETAEPTPTEGETTPTEPPEETPGETPPETPEDTPTDGDGAGFGVIVALIALIGAALLAARRNA